MRISEARQPDLQPPLFAELGYESRVCTIAACRNYMGDFFEELTVQLIGGQRLKTDSTRDVCPDIQVDDKTFIEAKSIGCSGGVIVYQCRLEKDLAFTKAQGVDLFYVLWNHGCRVADGILLGELRTGAAASVKSVTVLRLTDLAAILKTRPVKVLNSKHTARGYGAYGYNDGYCVPYSIFRNAIPKLAIPWSAKAYGRCVSDVDIHIDPRLAGRLLR